METNSYVVIRLPKRVPRDPDSAVPISAGTSSGGSVSREELNREEVRELQRDPSVLGVVPPLPMRLVTTVPPSPSALPAPFPGSTWGVRAIRAEAAPELSPDLTLAILDTGIDASHEAFSDFRVLRDSDHQSSVDAANKRLILKDFTGEGDGDRNGHGTHCAGTIFGKPIGEFRYSVAPGVRRVLVGKVLDRHGAGGIESIWQGIMWAVQEKAHIITLSLSIDFPGHVAALVNERKLRLEVATSRALREYRECVRLFEKLAELEWPRESGANPPSVKPLVIAAAGNESDRWGSNPYEIDVAPPAAAQGVISVGAFEQMEDGSGRFRVASFSNSGPTLAAPGSKIISARAGGGYTELAGTSMAAPHVAGAALLWGAKMMERSGTPGLDLVRSKLLGDAVFEPGWSSSDVGAGLVQAPVP